MRRLAVGLVLALGGCINVGLGGKEEKPEMRRHALDAASGVTARAGSAPSVGVRGFSARSRYDVRVVRRDGEDAFTYLEYDRWAEPPADSVGDAVREALSASRAFSFVGRAADGPDVDRWLDGYVLQFEMLRPAKGPMKAKCALRLTLTDRAGKALASGVFEGSRDLAGDSSAGLGPAMSGALGDVVNRALAEWGSAGLLK